MEKTLNGPGVGLGALLLSVNILTILTAKGLLSETEARELVELALVNLESNERLGGKAIEEASRSARAILELIRAEWRA